MGTITLGIDLGKRWFHVVGTDHAGHVTCRQRFNRTQLIEFVARHPPCLIGMETCCGSQYLARKFLGFGHDVKLLPAQYVKPFVKSQKNDFNDSLAIAEAVRMTNVAVTALANKIARIAWAVLRSGKEFQGSFAFSPCSKFSCSPQLAKHRHGSNDHPSHP